MRLKIGSITLTERYQFTQYSECAAWTDYVTCEPQTVDLFYDGYWVFASFNGSLTATTFPNADGWRTIGQPQKAHVQTQAWGGIAGWFGCENMLRVSITHPDYEIRQVSKYDDGRPMLALQRVGEEVAV